MLWAPYKRANRNTISEPSINLASKFCDAKSPWDSVINCSRSLVEFSSFRLLLRLVPGGVPAHSGYAARPVRSPEGAGACTLRLRRPTSFARGRSPRLWYGRALPCAGVQALPERWVSKKVLETQAQVGAGTPRIGAVRRPTARRQPSE